MSHIRADLSGFDRTASEIETSGAATVKKLTEIKEKVVSGSKSFFVANRGDAMRQKADQVFTEAITALEKFNKSLAEGIRTEKANIQRVDTP